MKRKLYNQLVEWKNSPARKPLVLEGARQVGKTWLMKEFGKNEYDNMVYVNCANNDFARNLFLHDLAPQRIIRDIVANSGQRIVPGRTLIVFDEIQDAFKLYLLDVGLLGALSETPAGQMIVSNDVFKEYKGAFSENYVLQQLVTEVPVIYYYSKENSRVEVDFLIQMGSRVIPVEVKAEDNVKSKSLKQFVTIDYANKDLKGLRCSMKPYVDQGWMENIPLYGVLGYMGMLSCKEKVLFNGPARDDE